MPAKRKPRAIKERQGTLRPSREPVNPAVTKGDLGKPPRGMSAPDKQTWEYIRETGWWIGDADRLMVVQLLDTLSDLAAVSAKINGADDMVFESKTSGYSQSSAWMSLRLRLRAEAVKYLGLLGFDPASRGKIETGSKPPDTAAEDFLFGGPRTMRMEE